MKQIMWQKDTWSMCSLWNTLPEKHFCVLWLGACLGHLLNLYGDKTNVCAHPPSFRKQTFCFRVQAYALAIIIEGVIQSGTSYIFLKGNVYACQRPDSAYKESLLWCRAETPLYQKECIYVWLHNYSPCFPAAPSFVLALSTKVCTQPGLSWLVAPLTR